MCFIEIENDLASAADGFGSFFITDNRFQLIQFYFCKMDVIFFGLAIGITAVFLLYIRTAVITRKF